MNYKLEGALKKSRKSFIICAILWLVLVIVFVGPFSYSIFEAKTGGTFDLTIFMEQLSGKHNKSIWNIIWNICKWSIK